MAEFIMKDIVRQRGDEDRFHIESAATSTEEIGNDMYPPARRKLTEMCIPYTRRAARKIRKSDYDEYDYIIGMDEYNRLNLERFFAGDPFGKLSNLMDFTDSPRPVPDPWFTGDFDSTYDDLLEGCTSLYNYIRAK